MAIEKIDKGGEITLTRNPEYPNTAQAGQTGRFVLGDVKDFLYEAEVHGATDDSPMFFQYHYSGGLERMLFKVSNGVVTTMNRVDPVRQASIRAIALTSAFWLACLLVFLISGAII